MCDILIYKARDKAVLIPKTPKGEKWIVDNYMGKLREMGGEQAIVINEEFANDYAEALVNDGISVTIK